MLTVVFVVIYVTVPSPQNNEIQKTYENFLLTAWLGDIELHWVFWPFFIVLNAGLLMADQLVKASSISVSSWDDIHFVLLFPITWWTVSTWRCSSHTQARIWAALARFATLAVFIEYGLKLWIRIDYPRIFFNCEELLLDYGSCF